MRDINILLFTIRSLLLIVSTLCPLSTQVANAEEKLQLSTVINYSLLPREKINPRLLGINAFANDQRFGTVRSQLREVKKTLRLRYVRVLFAWNDQVQPTPDSRIDFSFYDDITRNIPDGVDALVILTGVPTWMNNSDNWIENDPRKTFVEKWVRPVARRYRKKGRIIGYQIWNEPNDPSNGDNGLLDLKDSPANYVALASLSREVIKHYSPKKRLVAAATTAINQNFPETIEYNEGLLRAGIESKVDVFAMHLYGTHLENFLQPGGVIDLIGQLTLPIWITETGAKGTNSQLKYGEQLWPFLTSLTPSIRRIYAYQFTEASPADTTYGLRNLTPGRTVSDLYIYLRDRR